MQHATTAQRHAIAAVLPPGFRSAPAIDAVQALRTYIDQMERDLWHERSERQAACAVRDNLRARLKEYEPPSCPAGHFEVYYTHPDLGVLTCHVEAHSGCPASADDPGEDDDICLAAAYIGKVNIVDRLSESEQDAICAAFPRLFLEMQA